MRRIDARTVKTGDVELDNRLVVTYNPFCQENILQSYTLKFVVKYESLSICTNIFIKALRATIAIEEST